MLQNNTKKYFTLMVKIKQKRYNLVSKYLELFMNLLKTLLLFSPTFLFANDISVVFGLFSEVMHNLDEPVAQLILFVFAVILFIFVGVVYLVYRLVFRDTKEVDTRLHETISTEEETLLKKLSHYYLYASGSVIVLFIINLIIYNSVLDYLSILIPIALIFVLYRYLRDDKNLLLASLVFAILDFMLYVSFVVFDVEFSELMLLTEITKIDLFLVLEYLPLLLLLLFFVKNAGAPKYRFIYQFLMLPLLLGLFATLFPDFYVISFYLYSIVFVTFCLVAYKETRYRILR